MIRSNYMYRRSPILRAALSPTRKETTLHGGRSRLAEKIDKQVSRIRVLSGMEPAMITEQSKVVTVETPVTSASISGDVDHSSASNEIQRIQATVTELIGLFQQYRDVIDARVDNIKSELEAHVNDIIDRRLEFLQALPNHQSTAGPAPINEQAIAQMIQLVVEREMTLLELKRPLNGDIHRMREELGRVKEDQGRLVDKMRRINQLNCESHQKSLQAIKSIRDLINSRP